ncbi:hypothetical protein [Ketobacter sp.]|uniref:hypothetical protein n=1 Tax=Ketobacter sp. TaxID=2083498 RepID=UPI000F27BBBF|nr:hypothetical protein [Ketobacter sp.]RLU01398.1 MAG: hypothetical protein D9N14_03285 [Ketobacter sp.]
MSILKKRVAALEGQLKLGLEAQKLAIGKLLTDKVVRLEKIRSFEDVEFQIFSQFGDDGIIQWLISKLDLTQKNFVEFGVEDYRESNTRFLLMNNNWVGYIIDGSDDNINLIRESEYYWKYELHTRAAFVTRENINTLMSDFGLAGDIGLLHIDIDGNDYWVWKSLEVVSPEILILEYNSVFGAERAVTIPYNADFQRTDSHYSNLYFGASLKALCELSNNKGYAFVGCNSAGNNAYFVRKDKLIPGIRELLPQEGYVQSRFRESRDEEFNLTYITGDERLDMLRGMDVVDTNTGELVKL